MWKQIGKLALRILSVVLPVAAGLMLVAALFPMHYLDPEYAMYKRQKDILTNKVDIGSPSVLIIGDSRAKAAFAPEKLSDGCYNLSLGGTTPIEGYYTLKEYLEGHDAPKYVFLSYAPMHYEDTDTLWTRSIYFHMISDEDVFEIFNTASQYENTEKILPENYRLEWLMNKCYLPNKYCTAMRKGLFSGRYKANVEKYEELSKTRGQSYFGLDDENAGINGEAKEENFVPSDVITLYMNKIIDLCDENGIELIIEQTPMNETSLYIISSEYRHAFRDYMLTFLDGRGIRGYEYFYMFENSLFGDADHLNPEGVEKYCTAIRENYPEVFN